MNEECRNRKYQHKKPNGEYQQKRLIERVNRAHEAKRVGLTPDECTEHSVGTDNAGEFESSLLRTRQTRSDECGRTDLASLTG